MGAKHLLDDEHPRRPESRHRPRRAAAEALQAAPASTPGRSSRRSASTRSGRAARPAAARSPRDRPRGHQPARAACACAATRSPASAPRSVPRWSGRRGVARHEHDVRPRDLRPRSRPLRRPGLADRPGRAVGQGRRRVPAGSDRVGARPGGRGRHARGLRQRLDRRQPGDRDGLRRPRRRAGREPARPQLLLQHEPGDRGLLRRVLRALGLRRRDAAGQPPAEGRRAARASRRRLRLVAQPDPGRRAPRPRLLPERAEARHALAGAHVLPVPGAGRAGRDELGDGASRGDARGRRVRRAVGAGRRLAVLDEAGHALRRRHPPLRPDPLPPARGLRQLRGEEGRLRRAGAGGAARGVPRPELPARVADARRPVDGRADGARRARAAAERSSALAARLPGVCAGGPGAAVPTRRRQAPEVLHRPRQRRRPDAAGVPLRDGRPACADRRGVPLDGRAVPRAAGRRPRRPGDRGRARALDAQGAAAAGGRGPRRRWPGRRADRRAAGVDSSPRHGLRRAVRLARPGRGGAPRRPRARPRRARLLRSPTRSRAVETLDGPRAARATA